ncbi:MAG TPA: hypothetical protein VGC00_07740 [Thermoanaerobaculia bacterium]|jgi:hypothetical protein
MKEGRAVRTHAAIDHRLVGTPVALGEFLCVVPSRHVLDSRDGRSQPNPTARS